MYPNRRNANDENMHSVYYKYRERRFCVEDNRREMRETIAENRKIMRFERRRLPDVTNDTMTETEQTGDTQPKKSRLELLKEWKEQRKKREEQEKLSKKPLFKVPTGLKTIGSAFPPRFDSLLNTTTYNFTFKKDMPSITNSTTTKKRVEPSCTSFHKTTKSNRDKNVPVATSSSTSIKEKKDVNQPIAENEKGLRKSNRIKYLSVKPVYNSNRKNIEKKKNETCNDFKQRSSKNDAQNSLTKASCAEKQLQTIVETPQKDPSVVARRKSLSKELYLSDEVSKQKQSRNVAVDGPATEIEPTVCKISLSSIKTESGCLISDAEIQPKPRRSLRLSKKNEEMEIKKEICTPNNIHRTPNSETRILKYISPNVTLSRGKYRKDKEDDTRKKNNIATTVEELRIAGAIHFRNMLDKETNRLRSLCTIWQDYRAGEPELPTEANELIDVAVGQANLLIRSKFEQFSELVDNCQNETGEIKVTCTDLEGFWDMMYKQVENLDKRFEWLNQLRSTNWEEVVPVTEKVEKRVAPVKRQTKARAAKATSTIRDMIKAARKKKQNENIENEDPIIEVNTPSSRKNLKTPGSTNKGILKTPGHKSAKKNVTISLSNTLT